MEARGTLDLGDVAAGELYVPCARNVGPHVAREADGHELIPTSPDEQRLGAERAQARPEAVGAVRLLEVDLARGGVERDAPAGGEVRAQELVERGLQPRGVVGREDALEERLGHR